MNIPIDNVFYKILVAAQRAKDLQQGHQPRIICDNGIAVTALKEVENNVYTVQEYKTRIEEIKNYEHHFTKSKRTAIINSRFD